MIKKTVTYTNFNDEKKTVDIFLNLTKTELVEQRLEGGESFVADLEKIQAEKDVLKIYAIFKDLVLRAYGERSEDGERFVKSPELAENFSQTALFDELIYGMMTNPQEFVELIYNLIPADLRAQLQDEGKLPDRKGLMKQIKDAEGVEQKPAQPTDRKPKATAAKKTTAK